jgi:hypothetical protein
VRPAIGRPADRQRQVRFFRQGFSLGALCLRVTIRLCGNRRGVSLEIAHSLENRELQNWELQNWELQDWELQDWELQDWELQLGTAN